MKSAQTTCAERLGPYELGAQLGRGGMAEVYLARRSGPHGFAKRVALKRILPSLASDPHFVAMFCDEARISAGLVHRNIVQVLDFGESDGHFFLVMEYVDGVSVAKLLRAALDRRPFPLSAALFITSEVLKALAYAHEACDEAPRPLGIVHRDVSPGNVLISRTGEVKLTDFGILRSEGVDRRTLPGEVTGKLGYMSPEQVIGRDIDLRSDLFTLGIILGEMLLLRPMFTGDTDSETLSRSHHADLTVLDQFGGGLPVDVSAILRRALARERSDRFQSAREFHAAIGAAARATGANLDEGELIGWLAELGVLSSRSGTHEVTRLGVQKLANAAREGHLPSRLVNALAQAGPAISRSLHVATAEPRQGHPDQKADCKIRLPNGRVVGPLGLIEVCQLLGTGWLKPDYEISIRGNTYVALRSAPQLRKSVSRLGELFRDSALLEPAWHWQIQQRHLPRILFRFAAQRDP